MKKTMVVLFLILCILLVSETAFAKGKSEENYKAVMGSSSLGGTWYSCACKIGAVAEQYEGLNITSSGYRRWSREHPPYGTERGSAWTGRAKYFILCI